MLVSGRVYFDSFMWVFLAQFALGSTCWRSILNSDILPHMHAFGPCNGQHFHRPTKPTIEDFPGKRIEFSHEQLMECISMHATNIDKIRNTSSIASTPAWLWHASAWCRRHWKHLTTSSTKKDNIFRRIGNQSLIKTFRFNLRLYLYPFSSSGCCFLFVVCADVRTSSAGRRLSPCCLNLPTRSMLR